MEQTNASEEIIIQEIAMEVESEFQLGGLSDGLYFTFAAEVAKRYALLAVSKEREKMEKEVRKMWDYPCRCMRLNESCTHNFDTMFSIINLINTK